MFLLIILNLGGTTYGFYYYAEQLLETSFYKMIFVPDCPLYTLFLAMILIGYLSRKTSPLFSTIAFIGLVKYGFWTLFVMIVYYDFFLASLNIAHLLFVLHIGMIAEAFLLPLITKIKAKHVLIAVTWFLLNDIMDYFYGTMPLLPVGHTKIVMIQSFAATIIIGMLLLKFKERLE